MAADTMLSLPEAAAAVRSDGPAGADAAQHRPLVDHRALKRSMAPYVEPRAAEPPSSPNGMPGLLTDFIDGKQSRA